MEEKVLFRFLFLGFGANQGRKIGSEAALIPLQLRYALVAKEKYVTRRVLEASREATRSDVQKYC